MSRTRRVHSAQPGGASHAATDPRQHQELDRQNTLEQRLLRMARRDFLTDLLNRYAFDERLELALAQANRFSHQVALLLIDLDDFKFVNDTHGHSTGDGLLRAIARRLRSQIRKVDAIARLGGDEFAVIHTELGSVDSIAEFARRVMVLLEQPFEVDGHELHISASIGIAVYPPGGSEARPLLRQADLAMYKAKEAGGHTFRFHVRAMDKRVQERMALQRDLNGALERHELFLRYQPQIRLRDGAIIGAEALLRWTHPERGPVDPQQFIPIAEASGEMIGIGRWVLRSAILQAKKWRAAAPERFTVAVNLSPVQFRDPGFAHWLLDTLRELGVEPQKLELELTEEVLMRSRNSVESALFRLHDHGVRFSLDNFGSGISALESLHKFPFDRLKIAMKWTHRLHKNPQDTALVSAIIALAGKLGLEVVAEGIETRRQARELAEQGCDAGQGYLFSLPLSSEGLAQAFEHDPAGRRFVPLRAVRSEDSEALG